MRLYSWLELFKARLRHFSRLSPRLRRSRVSQPLRQVPAQGSLAFERLEARTLLAAPTPFDLSAIDGINGFAFNGEVLDDYHGFSVQSAGDVDVDGFDDLIITSPAHLGRQVSPASDPDFTGRTYLLLGGPNLAALDGEDGTVDGQIDLANIAGQGFEITNQAAGLMPDTPENFDNVEIENAATITATGVGDMNGDGVADIAISQPFGPDNTTPGRGRAYVIWSQSDEFNAAIVSGTFDLSSPNLNNTDTTDTFGETGIRIRGSQNFAAGPPRVHGSTAGYSISAAGDIDGDGYDDLIIGEHLFDANTGNAGSNDHGRAYIVFGKSIGFNNDGGWFDQSLVTLGDGQTHSFSISSDGNERFDYLGLSVTGLGDINGDGRDDFAVSAPYASSSIGDGGTGRTYVIFGGERGSLADATGDLDGTNGFRIDGDTSGDFIGWQISSAGDINGDGMNEIVIGAPFADPAAGSFNRGAAYVVFGRTDFSGLPSGILSLRTELDGGTGFRIEGQYAGDYAGSSVSGGGDIDGDGFDDLIIGARGYNGGTGRTYVVFGRKTGFDPFVLLADTVGVDPTVPTLAPSHIGFAIDGIGFGDQSGWAVSHAGDVNGDGFDDILIGSPFAAGYDATQMLAGDTGESYVFFGGNFRNRPGFQVGTAGDDVLDGATTPADDRDRLIGHDGDDDLIIDGGPDVAYGGRGNDRIFISDTDFFISTVGVDGDPVSTRRINGGLGRDELIFDTSGMTLDLTTIPDNRIENIELIDIRNTGGGFNTLILDVNEVRRISSAGFTAGPFPPTGFGEAPTGNTLVVRRSIGDDVQFGGGWTKLFDVVDDDPSSSTFGVTFEGFAQGDELGQAILLIEDPTVLNLVQLDGIDPTDGSTNGTQPNGHQGVTIPGLAVSDNVGHSIAGVGDVDNDGFDDFIVGAFGANGVGAAYLVYGEAGPWDPVLALATLNGTTGVRIDGIDVDDDAGVSVAALGDVDGDGFDDFIIGANRADVNAPGNTSEGEAYLVFGRTFDGRATGPIFALSTLETTTPGGPRDGYIFRGTNEGDFAGFAVGGGGDVNGDGLGDLVIGAFQADSVTGYDTSEGKSYVIFGGERKLGADPQSFIDLDAADGTNDGLIELDTVGDATNHPTLAGIAGFQLDGVNVQDLTGRAVGFAGDVNGDGFSDFLISGHGVDSDPLTSTITNEGAAYLIFGKADWSATPVVSLGSLDGTNGVQFNGELTPGLSGDFAGWASRYAGDVNGDGFDDVIIGAYRSNQHGIDSGRAYIVFGKSTWTANVGLGTINGTNGFIVNGGGLVMYNNGVTGATDNAGFAVAGVGDFNGDGFDDVAIGAPRGLVPTSIDNVIWDFGRNAPDPNFGYGDGGQVYLVFGKQDWSSTPVFEPETIDGLGSLRIDGRSGGFYTGFELRSLGDVNGDGFDDFGIGAPQAPYGLSVGEGYLIFGGSFLGNATPQTDYPGTNTLTAVNGANPDALLGGTGDDLLISDGGDDILEGAEGDDNLVLPDVIFAGPRRIDGGNGVDTLTFGDGTLAPTVGGAHLNLTTLGDNRIQNIEIIDITGNPSNVATDATTVDNTLTLDVQEVFNISSSARGRAIGSTLVDPDVPLSNTLVVRRDFGDVVNIGAGWTPDANAVFDPVFMQYFNGFTATPNTFTMGTATLFIQNVNVVINGDTATVNGTSGDDVIIYDAQNNELTFNGVVFDLDDPVLNGFTEVSKVVVNGFGGTDRVELRGSQGDDIANVGLTMVAATFTVTGGSSVFDAPGTVLTRTLTGSSVEISTLDGRGQDVADTLVLTDSGQSVDLTTPFTNLDRGLEIIDITGTGDNSLTLNFNSVTANNAAFDATYGLDTLTILRDFGDTVTILDDAALWTHNPFAEWDPVRMTFFEQVSEAPELLRIESPLVTINGSTANVVGSNLDNVITYDAKHERGHGRRTELRVESRHPVRPKQRGDRWSCRQRFADDYRYPWYGHRQP